MKKYKSSCFRRFQERYWWAAYAAFVMLVVLIVMTVKYWPAKLKEKSTPRKPRTMCAIPELVHLSYGSDPSEMVVTWATIIHMNESLAQYGTKKLDFTASGNSTLIKDPAKKNVQLYIHRVVMTGLVDTKEFYYYRCGSPCCWSPVFKFRSMTRGNGWSPRFLVYGDFGTENAQSYPYLLEDIRQNTYDAVLHLGDFAYDMHSYNGETGIEFLQMIEPIAANIPYMTCPGDHEASYNFFHYNQHFSMKRMDGTYNNMLYSWNIGPAHIISFSTVTIYVSVKNVNAVIVEQYKWLEKDLKKANQPENRSLHPWIIIMGHHPMYCSHNASPPDCINYEGYIRVGHKKWTDTEKRAYGLEYLFVKYGVDLLLWGHDHYYFRLWPIFNRTVYNGSLEEPYKNPKAPVHITTGSAGNREMHDKFNDVTSPWTAFQHKDYGYSRMTIHNKSHLYLEQVSTDLDGKIVDSITLVKDHHSPEKSFFVATENFNELQEPQNNRAVIQLN